MSLLAVLITYPLICLFENHRILENQHISDASVWIRADPDGVGSGWVVNVEKKWVLTCRHVVGERNTVELFFPWKRDGKLVTERSEYLANRDELRRSGLLVIGKVLRISDESDLALVELPRLPEDINPLPIAAADGAHGEAVKSVGHRGDLETLWNMTTGTIRQRGRLADGYFWQGQKLAGDMPAIAAQLPIEEGDSGAPVINHRGEVVGMVSALRRRCPQCAVGPNTTAIRKFIGEPEPKPVRAVGLVSKGDVVLVRPAATDSRLAGVLIDVSKRWVLTACTGLGSHDQVAVVFPKTNPTGDLVGEKDEYRDGLSLGKAGLWRTGRVLAREPRLDLALIQLDTLPKDSRAMRISTAEPVVGDKVRQLGHPTGVEFLWMHSEGTLRQRGRLALGRDAAEKSSVNVFQLPAQGNAAGGVLTNAKDELIGLTAGKEGPQGQIAYAASVAEVRMFLDSIPSRNLLSALTFFHEELGGTHKLAAWAWCAKAQNEYISKSMNPDHRSKIREYSETALRLSPGCGRARWLRGWVASGERQYDLALDSFDAAIPRNLIDADNQILRSWLWVQKKEYKKARGELELLLECSPGLPLAYARLALLHVMIGDTGRGREMIVRGQRVEPDLLGLVAMESFAHSVDIGHGQNEGRAVEWLEKVTPMLVEVMPQGEKQDAAAAALRRAQMEPNLTMKLQSYKRVCLKIQK